MVLWIISAADTGRGFCYRFGMDTFFANWLMLIVVFTVALATPGPDFVMAVRNAVAGSRRAGISIAIGFGLGVAVQSHIALRGWRL